MDSRACWLGLYLLPGLGAHRVREAVEKNGSVEAAWQAAPQQLAQMVGLTRRQAENLAIAKSKLEPEKELEKVYRLGASVVTLGEADYPELLAAIYDPPPVLFYRGQLPAHGEPAIAVVGSRRATLYGKTVAEQLGRDLAASGAWVVSGLARGVDTCAHRGALRVGGPTAAVLGCGLDIVYPRENKQLMNEITENGLVLTSYPLGTPPEAQNFPARNRIISGLSLGIVVVEAAASSGALITADFALEQGRDVFAVPGPITCQASQGTNRLIKDGAKLVAGVEDVLDEYSGRCLFNQVELAAASSGGPVLSTIEDNVIGQLNHHDPRPLEWLVYRTGLGVAEVTSVLTFLEIKGLIQCLPGRLYVRR